MNTTVVLSVGNVVTSVFDSHMVTCTDYAYEGNNINIWGNAFKGYHLAKSEVIFHPNNECFTNHFIYHLFLILKT